MPLAYICRRRAAAARCRAAASRWRAVWRADVALRAGALARLPRLEARVVEVRVDEPRADVLARRFV
jgi:hypothetical protein